MNKKEQLKYIIDKLGLKIEQSITMPETYKLYADFGEINNLKFGDDLVERVVELVENSKLYNAFLKALAFDIKEYKAHIKACEDLVKVQCSKGNYDYDEYMWGVANGSILILATMKGETPEFLDKPNKFINEKKIDE